MKTYKQGGSLGEGGGASAPNPPPPPLNPPLNSALCVIQFIKVIFELNSKLN